MQNKLSQFHNIGAWIEHWADCTPQKEAFIYLGDDENDIQSITYLELMQRSHTIAAALLQSGQPGDRIILTYQPGMEFIAAFLGCLQAGFIAVPVYPPTSPKDWPRFVKIVLNSDARRVCTTSSLAQLSQAGIAMTPQLAGIEVIATDALNTDASQQVVCQASAESIAFLQYTSGSTGNPKGVMLTHGNLHHNECLIKEALHLNQDSLPVCWLPQYHDMGLIGNILGSSFNGMTAVMMSPLTFLKQPFRWLKAISDYKATISGGPNFSYELCVKRISDEQLSTLDLSSWTLAFNGAEPIRASTLEKFDQRFRTQGFNQQAFTPLYGLAESSLLVTHHPFHAPLATFDADSDSLAKGKPIQADGTSPSKLLVSSGQAIGQTLRIVNPESGELCRDLEVGEIWIQGDSVAQGYWKNPEATAETFQAYINNSQEGPFLRSGDLGFLQGEALFITGRLKEMMIVDGRNLYPQDIEETIQAITPAFRIGCGAVFSLDDETVVAVQELSNRSEHSEQELADFIQAALRAVNEQHQFSLSRFVLLEQGSLLKTSSGKIRRTAMGQLYQQDKLKAITQYSPRDFLKSTTEAARSTASLSQAHYEAVILSVVADALDIPAQDINPQTTFSDFGLDSKTLVGMAGTLEERLKQPLPAQLFFDYPSTLKLAAYLCGQADTVESPLKQNSGNGDIAIVGIGCRLPGQTNSPAEFWRLLEHGEDAISETPVSRWDNREYYDQDILAPGKMTTRWGGYIQREKDFDAAFFDIKEREATLLDPQQRILLETSWHAFEHAGITPESTAGRDIGVFVGISNVDYDRHCSRLGASSEPYAGTGNATSIAANRLSYFYDWRGPSVAVDTACSSSLVALHQACQSLQQNECELALAAGVNLILAPDLSITFSKSGMMAADGRCKTFDDGADGYVRSEGCGVLILKPLEQAQRDNDNIIAVIKGSAITQDGRSNGITAPNGPAQVKTIRKALQVAGLNANDVQYVECHGTGTALGDPIELQALAQAYGTERTDTLLIGSVKTNIGHLESAAGIAGVIKTALALQKQMLPRNLHLNNPNSRFDWQANPLDVVINNTPWIHSSEGKRRAGVSSFGFGGTNAHVILEEAPPAQPLPPAKNNAAPIGLFCLSAKDRNALQGQIRQYLKYLEHTDTDFETLLVNQNCGRTHFEERLVIKCDSLASLQTSLRTIEWSNLRSNVFSSRRRVSNQQPNIIWMFTGQGAQYLGMGRELYQQHASFRAAIDQCHDILAEHADIQLRDFILDTENQVNQSLIDQTDYTQPVLFCYEYALAQILLNAGQQPDRVMGHSLGEIVAATIAGVLSVEDGIKMAAVRGKLMQDMDNKGGMMAAFAHKEDILPLLEPFPLISIGALNGPGQVVLSGCENSLAELEIQLQESGIETRHLNVSHGFHSPLMEPMLNAFREQLKNITFNAPRLEIISNVSAATISNEITSIEYWCRHVVATVNFQGGLQYAVGDRHAILLEVGPKPTLSAIAKRSLGRDSVRVIPLINDSKQEQESLLNAFAQCYTAGMNLNWAAFMQSHVAARTDLPLYPFQRKFFWLTGTLTKANEAAVQSNSNVFHPLLGSQQHSPYLKSGERHYVAYPGIDANNWAGVFKQRDTIHYHLSHFLEMAIEVAHDEFQTRKLNLLDLELHKRVSFIRGDSHSIHTIAERRANNELRIQFYTQDKEADQDAQWILLCSVSVSSKIASRLPSLDQVQFTDQEDDLAPAMATFFAASKQAQTHYCANDTNVVLSAQAQDNTLLCEVDFSSLVSGSASRLWIKPEAVQGLYQILGFFCESMRNNQELRPGVEFTPYCVRNIIWNGKLPQSGFVLLRHIASWAEDAEHTEIDLSVFDNNGQLAVKIEGILLKSRIKNTLTLAEKVRNIGIDERINIIGALIADSLAANLGGQAMDIDMSRSLAELGVDSITVISTLSRLKNELCVEIQASEIHRARSVENFVALLAAKLGTQDTGTADTTMRGTCAVLREGHAGVLPLFLIHPGNDGALQYLDLANAFGEEIPLYVMLPELDNHHQSPIELQQVVDQLVADIRSEQPHGPYMLTGWSLGSTLAVLIANQLVRQGEEIKFVSVIDSPCLMGTGFTADELQLCVEQITGQQMAMSEERRIEYRVQLQELYSQALSANVPPITYELKHFQTGNIPGDSVPNAGLQDWAALTNRRTHSQTIPGDHLSLFKSGNVETLASFLRRQIRSSSTTQNRFLLETPDRGGLAQSVLTDKPEINDHNRPVAQLRLDEDHPYFFDHELDHIPGILILAGAWELVCRSTLEIDPLNPMLSRSVGHCSLLFDRFAEKDQALFYELNCVGGNPYSIDLECYISQGRQRIGTFFLQLNYAHKKPKLSLPDSRHILAEGYDLLHKQIESNVLINQPTRSETRWQCTPQMPEAGHYLHHTTLGYSSLNPIYVLEATRQFLTYLSHDQFGVDMGTHVNLVDISLDFNDVIDFSQEVQMILSPRQGIVARDSFQTIAVIWQQAGRTVVNSQITAQITRDETYHKQRAR